MFENVESSIEYIFDSWDKVTVNKLNNVVDYVYKRIVSDINAKEKKVRYELH